ncbi:MDR/zinc-dependent alcohol dehydrogenase-like family protein [Planctomycetes bacterium K23_9]|uniref:2-deoxy-scyllo-inosamine dehydrogenase n=1 Tax=Stieleria marina TaxID=1930275 RepID=A0A517NN23_9BACT|nr:2-deoxy-scyllo-inosamine dehydrogenase [Planctomycetes bacterium K23_9]
MQAIAIRSGKLVFEDNVPAPTTKPDEVLVRVTQAGICETDLQLVAGYMDFTGILGHEFVGFAQSGKFSGQRVVGEINCNCRNCDRCKAGLGNHCANRSVVGIFGHDGAFAQTIAVPEKNLHQVHDNVSDDEAVFVEPLAAAFQITDQVKITDDQRLLILGDGRLAFMCAIVLKLTGAPLTVVGKHSGKLDRFNALGAQTVRLGAEVAPESFDVVVDCTGSPSGLPLAMQLVRPRGTIVMKTTVAASHDVSLAPIVINEINLVGSRCGPFDQAIAAIENGNVQLDSLITHRFQLRNALAAFESAKQGDAFKVVFEISNSGESHG